MKKLSILFALICFLMSPVIESQAQDVKDYILGKYQLVLEDGPNIYKDSLEIIKSGDKYFGKVFWLKDSIDPETGEPLRDKHNPIDSLKRRHVMGLTILKDCEFINNGWEKGSLYNFKNGITNGVTLKFINQVMDTLEVNTGGRTTYWTKKKKTTSPN